MARHASWLSVSPELPTQAEAALAIAILRSKPSNLKARDYVLQLRQHIKAGPSPYLREQGHHLDLVAYWQEQYHRLQEECESLKSLNVKLERSNQALSSSHLGTLDDRPVTPMSIPKRPPPTSPSKSPKRRKANSSTDPVNQTQDTIEGDFDLYEGLGKDGLALIEGIYSTHQLCRASSSDPDKLSSCLLGTASSLAKVIRLVAENHESLSRHSKQTAGPRSLGDDRSEFALSLTASARAFMSILVGTTRLMDIDSDERLPGLVVCALVDIFKTTLLAIESCAHRTGATTMTHQTSSKKGKANQVAKKPQESTAARSLAHFLTGLIGLLDPGNVTHQKIFDGFMYLLLERIGKRLYYCTFGRHRHSSNENGLFHDPTSTSGPESELSRVEKEGIRLEVKALMLILQRAMGLAPHHMKQSNRSGEMSNATRIGRTLTMKTLPSAPRTRLSTIAKDRLQRTLVNCMYGGKEDDEFLDVLTKPVPSVRPSSLQNVARMEDEDVEQWYKEEIWRVIGWDILARERPL